MRAFFTTLFFIATLSAQGAFVEYAEVEGDNLRIDISYYGGCQKHIFDLSVKSCSGKLCQLELVEDSQGDKCRHLMPETLEFSLEYVKKMIGEKKKIAIYGDRDTFSSKKERTQAVVTIP